MSLVGGIDFSSNCVDVVLLDEDRETSVWERFTLGTRPLTAFVRARQVREVLPPRGRWVDRGVVMFAIERPMGAAIRATAVLMRVQGAVLACLPPQLPVLELPPEEWKRETVGRGNASKDDVAVWAREHAGAPNGWPQDALDALAIAWAAHAMCERAAALQAPVPVPVPVPVAS